MNLFHTIVCLEYVQNNILIWLKYIAIGHLLYISTDGVLFSNFGFLVNLCLVHVKGDDVLWSL